MQPLLRRHIRSRHGSDKEFVCGECGMRFTRRDILTRHLKSAKHSKSSPEKTSPGEDTNMVHQQETSPKDTKRDHHHTKRRMSSELLVFDCGGKKRHRSAENQREL